MALDLYQLKTFYTFGKIRKFTQTADRLYVTQSAVSHALKKLEQSVGTKLYRKQGKDFILTGVGEMLFKSCENIFHEIEKFEEGLAAGGKQIIQKIYLGAPPEFGTTILIQQLALFFKKYPHIHVDFLYSNDLRIPLQRDEVDLAVDCKTHHKKNLESIFLFEERYVVIASPAYVEEHQIKEVGDLERVNILSLDKEGDWWDNFLMAIPIDRRPKLKNIMQINHVRGLINGAISGVGVSFVPRYTVETELEEKVLIDIFGGLAMDDRFCIYIKKERKEFEKNKLLINFLLKAFANFVA
jgi:DNA-binding transcriptional LysR family regulator